MSRVIKQLSGKGSLHCDKSSETTESFMFFNRFLVKLEPSICFEARDAGTLVLKAWFVLVLKEKE